MVAALVLVSKHSSSLSFPEGNGTFITHPNGPSNLANVELHVVENLGRRVRSVP